MKPAHKLSSFLVIPALLCTFNFTTGLAEQSEPQKASGVYVSTNFTKCSEFIGMEVHDNLDEKIGKISDLSINLANGRVVHAIVSVGGILGVGDTEVAVPISAFTINSTRKLLFLNADKENLKLAPKFESDKWADFYKSDRVSESHRYFGQEPELLRMTEEEKAAGMVYANVKRDSDGNRLLPRDKNGPWGFIQKGSKLIGASVKNLKEEKIGKIDDLLINLHPGRVIAVIVSSGGFLGMGEELSAVPPIAFHFSKDQDTLTLDTTKELLASAPHFKNTTWPNWQEPTYGRSVYMAYRAESFYDKNAILDADNSAKNLRDRQDGSVTPIDQGSSAVDIGITQGIRKEIMEQKNFSINAQNIKIITLNGKVTLRGPVSTQAEKAKINEITLKYVTSRMLDNLLEVTVALVK